MPEATVTSDAAVMSDATVKSHIGRLPAKLGLGGRVQALILAFPSGLDPR